MADPPIRDPEQSVRNGLLEQLLTDGIDSGLFTGAGAAVGSSEGIEWQTTLGERDPRTGDPVTDDTRFDAASTTKPVVTTTVVLRLVEEGVLALSAPLGAYVPPLDGTDRGGVSLRQLLTHTSGLQPYHYDESWGSSDAARADIYDADLLEAPPGERFRYSCLNFVHLVDAARRATDAPFADLAQRYVFDRAGMGDADIGPVADDNVAVTYDHDHADRALVGEINDPIARALDGESGNAGLFATVSDFARFAEALLTDCSSDGRPSGGPGLLAPGTVGRMRRNWTTDMERPHGLGWRLARDCYPAPNWSLSSFGHTGYTGTSVWLDPEADRFAVLLTNEVYCGKENGMIRFRERFHSAVAGERY